MKAFVFTLAVLYTLNTVCGVIELLNGSFFEPLTIGVRTLSFVVSAMLGVWAVCLAVKGR
jgi:hypothetical protein